MNVEKPLNIEELTAELDRCISVNFTHTHYERTVEVAEWCRQIMTGKGQDELIVSYKPRETDEQKENRVAIYNSMTREIGGMIEGKFKKIQKAESVVDVVDYADEENKEGKLEKIRERLDHYQGGALDYAHEAVRHLNFYDPNAWLFTSFYKDLEQENWSFPVEIYSEQVRDYRISRSGVGWLIYRTPCAYVDGKEVKSGWKWHIINQDYLLIYRQCAQSEKVIKTTDRTLFFEVEEKRIFAGSIPLQRIGYVKDPETNRETFVSPLYPVDHIFLDMINTKSEYDLTRALHGFMQKFVYAENCNHKEMINGIAIKCNDGYINGHECGKCKGTGKVIHKTVQDTVYVKYPRDTERGSHIPLSELAHYIEIPQHQIERYKADLEDYRKAVSLTLFSVDIFERPEIAQTATEVIYQEGDTQDVLGEMANKVSEVYKGIVKTTAGYLSLDKDLIINHTFSGDFHMESLGELISIRKGLVDAGAPYETIHNIDLRILKKQAIDNPLYIDFIKAKETFRPFKEKSEMEILNLVNSLNVNERQVLLYNHFEAVFEEIQHDWANVLAMAFPELSVSADNVLFQNLKYAQQRHIIDVVLAQYKIDENFNYADEEE